MLRAGDLQQGRREWTRLFKSRLLGPAHGRAGLAQVLAAARDVVVSDELLGSWLFTSGLPPRQCHSTCLFLLINVERGPKCVSEG